MGKNRSNQYCDVCKKIHRPGKHIPKVIGDAVKGDINAIASIMRVANRNLYLSRDMLGDTEEFKESDIIKEDDKDESEGTGKKDK